MKNEGKEVCILDTNVLSYWVSGKILKQLHVEDRILKIYQARYKNFIELIEKIIFVKTLSKKYEFYIFEFSLLEIRNAIKEEILSSFLFEKGIPISKWTRSIRDDHLIKEFNKKVKLDFLLEKINAELDILAYPKINLNILEDLKPSSNKNYFDVFDDLVFKTSGMNTQDMYLLTNSIVNEADYFVTADKSLKKYSDFTKKKYNLAIVDAAQMLAIIKN